MLGYVSVIKQRVKEGMTEKYVALVKDFSVESIQGCCSREIVEVDEHDFIIIVEYEDISSVIDAQEALVSNLDRIRHLLVKMMMRGMYGPCERHTYF